jgi:hypothetical protein
MPRLRELRLWPLFYVREARGMASSDGGLDFGLGNLLSLQEVKIEILRAGATKEEAEQAMVPLTHVASIQMKNSEPEKRFELMQMISFS